MPKYSTPLNPAPQLLTKLGSIVVHVEEMLSPHGHAVDKLAIEPLLRDSDVQHWLRQMQELALVPVKRN